MEPAFWDSSALVPLCMRRSRAQGVLQLTEEYEVVAWWATPVEARSAFARELRQADFESVGVVGRPWNSSTCGEGRVARNPTSEGAAPDC